MLIQRAALLGHYLGGGGRPDSRTLERFVFSGNIADGDNNSGGEWLSNLFLYVGIL